MKDNVSLPVGVFISYAHKDRKYLEPLCESLAAIGDGPIEQWSDQDLKAGDDWQQKIDEALNVAQVAVLMVSRAFVASDFIRESEFPYLMQARTSRDLRIVWFLLEDCLFEKLSFENSQLESIQSPVKVEKPIKKMSGANRATAWKQISRAVESAAKDAARANVAVAVDPRVSSGTNVDDFTRAEFDDVKTGRVNLAQTTGLAAKERPGMPGRIDTFYGLDPNLPPLEDNDADFQDFVVDENVEETGLVNNPICYLWADARSHNFVKATVIEGAGREADANALEIEFCNHRETWPSNVALHPQDHQARRRTNRQRELCLDAHSLDDDGAGEPIVLSIRVVDELLRHWVYRVNARNPDEIQFRLPRDGSWQTCHVDLANANHWRLYESDGNRSAPSSEPDFALIVAIVITVGRDSKRMAGSGKLRVANIRLRPRSRHSRQGKAK